MSQPFLILLRGINVGGKNIIAMSALRDSLTAAGFTQVQTYIQSGNVLLCSHLSEKALQQQVQAVIQERFGIAIRVWVLTQAAVEQIIKQKPPAFGQNPDQYRYDVLFLSAPELVETALSQLTLKQGVDKVTAGPGVLYFTRQIAKLSQSHLSRIVQLPIYQEMTIRNWNTTKKLGLLIQQPATE